MDTLDPPDLTPYEFRVFSQNGEDGIISEILSRIGMALDGLLSLGSAQVTKVTVCCSPMCTAGMVCSAKSIENPSTASLRNTSTIPG